MRDDEKKIKTVFNIYEPLINILKIKFSRACLKRDAYLDLVFQCETEYLKKEITKNNSDKAKNYLAYNLKELNTKQLNLSLSSTTIKLMTEVCKEKNINRDNFVNRIFLFLVASDAMILSFFSELEFVHSTPSKWDDYWVPGDPDVCYESKDYKYFVYSTNSLDSMEETVRLSPFWKLRWYLDSFSNGLVNLYSYSLDKHALSNLSTDYGPLRLNNILGFNTYMNDDVIAQQENLDDKKDEPSETEKILALIKQEKLKKLGVRK